MNLQFHNLLLVEVLIRPHLVLHSDALHIVDLGSRELICVLDGTFADLLVQNGLVDRLTNGVLLGGRFEVLVSLIGVLISLYSSSGQVRQIKSVRGVTDGIEGSKRLRTVNW